MFRSASCLIVSLLVFSGLFGNEFNIARYDIKVDLDSSGNRLVIKATLAINQVRCTNLNFNFSDKYTIDSVSGRTILQVSRVNSRMISLKIIRPGPFVFSICYHISLDSVITDNKIINLLRSDRWIPCQYDNISEYNLKVAVPDSYYVLVTDDPSSRQEVFGNSIYCWELKHISDLPLIIYKKSMFSQYKVNNNGTEITFHYFTKDEATIQTIMSNVSGSFNYYNRLFGRHPHTSYNFVEIPGCGYALSYEGGALIGSNLIYWYKEHEDIRYWPGHELCHQWIGCGIRFELATGDSLRGFIEEGLTQYLYLKSMGKEFLNESISQYIEKYNNEICGSSEDLPVTRDMKSKILYLKGPVIFHAIARSLSEKKFDTFIEKMFNEYNDRIINSKIFFMELKKYHNPGEGILSLISEHHKQLKLLPP